MTAHDELIGAPVTGAHMRFVRRDVMNSGVFALTGPELGGDVSAEATMVVRGLAELDKLEVGRDYVVVFCEQAPTL